MNNHSTEKQKRSLRFSSISSVTKLFATLRKDEQWGGVTAGTALVLVNRIKGTRLRTERQISVTLWNSKGIVAGGVGMASCAPELL